MCYFWIVRNVITEVSVLLEYNAALLDNWLPTFWSDLFATLFRVEMFKKNSWTFRPLNEMLLCFIETSDTHYLTRFGHFTYEDETTALPRKVLNQLPSDALSYLWTTKSSTDSSVFILCTGIWKGSLELRRRWKETLVAFITPKYGVIANLCYRVL